ncbi:MAG: acyl-[Lachnospiraceae bacterium]|nr:acyl-[acyl-carrier-protein] thioesterase [Lachnospiraceae bacterium]
MYQFQSRIRYSETDRDGRLTLPALLNYFQDVTTFHSEDLDVGISYMKRIRQVWVLSAWQIVIERYPAMGEQVEIGTIPYEFKAFMGSRNFFMKDGAGRFLAKGNSLWSLLDMDTGRPITPSQEMMDTYGCGAKLEMDYAPRKIAVPKEGGVLREAVMVRRHHLDTNQHVNNGQFVQMAAEYLPEHFVVKQLRVEYRQQAFLNDVMYPMVFALQDSFIVEIKDTDGKPYVIVEFSGVQEEV